MKQRSRRYTKENPEKISENKKSYYLENFEIISEKNRDSRLKDPRKSLFNGAKARANRERIPFSIAPEDIVIPDVCPIFKTKFTIGKKLFLLDSPSLDKIIPELGYVPGNIAVMSWRANSIKSTGTVEQHRRIAEWAISPKNCVQIHPNTETKSIRKMLLRKSKERAVRDGLDFNLVLDDIFVPSVCPILNISISQGKGKLWMGSPSLDRLDPKAGYTPENINVISYKANKLKNSGTAEEHEKIAIWMEKETTERHNVQYC